MSEQPTLVLVAYVLGLLLLVAFFAGTEVALLTVNRYRLRSRANAGDRAAQLDDELAQRNAKNLAQTFQELDAARPNWIRRIPGEDTVAAWIAQARSLDKVVSH